jgi:hypothetical protein
MTKNNTDFSKIAIDDFEKVKAAKIMWIEVAEKLRNPIYRSQYSKLLEKDAERMGLHKESYVRSSIRSLEIDSEQTKSSLPPFRLIEIYNDIKNRNPDFDINVPDDIYFKNIAFQDFEKIKAAKITWVEVAEKLNNPFYKESYIQLLREEAYENNLNREDYVNSSIEQLKNASFQIVNRLSKDQLKELYNDIISRNPDFNIKLPERGLSEHDRLNIDLESIEKDNIKYLEAKEDLYKHLNNKITDIEIAEKLNSDLEYKIAFTRYLEKDFYDKNRIGIDAKSYAEQRISAINLSLRYEHKEVKEPEGFYSQEKVTKVDDNWIDNQKETVSDDEPSSILDILNKMKATPDHNGDVVYSLDDHIAFTDKGQSIQFSSENPTDDEIIAAILLAKEKYHNSFALTGPKDYQERVMKIMVDNNITVNLLNKNQAKIFAKMQENANETPNNKENANETPNNKENTNETPNNKENTNETPNNKENTNEIPNNKENTNEIPNNSNDKSDFSNIEKSDQPSSSTVNSNRGEPDMNQQNTNTDQKNQDYDNGNKKILALRGAVRNEDGTFTQNVLLWKSENEKGLSGRIVTPDGVTHQVKADIISRKDGKSNFLAIKVKSPQEGEGKPPYIDWGYANAVNSRKDSKEVYFDEVIFNLQKLKQYAGLILKARVTDKVSDQLHKDLGFIEKRQTRPKFEQAAKTENSDSVSNDESNTPKESKKTRKTRKASV